MIDLSQYNAVNGLGGFQAMHRAGQRRVYLRATQGAHELDSHFVTYRALAERAGLKVGAYHVVWPHVNSPWAELQNMLRHARLYAGLQLRPMLDVETGNPNGEGAWVEQLSNMLARRAHVRAGVYGSLDFLERCRFSRGLADESPLWLAYYGSNDGRAHSPPRLPRPWRRCAAQQYTSRGHVAGVSGAVDRSVVFHAGMLDHGRQARAVAFR